MPLTHKVALITAVGRGLSRGIALTFGRDGAATHDRASMAPGAQGRQPAEPLTAGIVEATALTAANDAGAGRYTAGRGAAAPRHPAGPWAARYPRHPPAAGRPGRGAKGQEH
jgi:NAD(P)-dependent dehydrogenase (short-subunit alcohol dehydrogenase family)